MSTNLYPTYGFAEIEGLWIQGGGQQSHAVVAAAIALAESRGYTGAHNDNPATGDDSYGLWQINYYGSLRAGRTAEFGPPQGLLDSPLKNAQAAVLLSNNGNDFSAWSTYTGGAYKRYLPGAIPSPVAPGGGDIPGVPTPSPPSPPSPPLKPPDPNAPGTGVPSNVPHGAWDHFIKTIGHRVPAHVNRTIALRRNLRQLGRR